MKRIVYFSLTAMLILAVALSGCGGGSSNPRGGGSNPGGGGAIFNPGDGGQGTGVVYCGGYYMDGGSRKPRYWASNNPQPGNLDANGLASADVNGIGFYDGKVYCIGNDYTGNGNVPYYWIDSQRYSLNNDNSIDTVVQCFSIMDGKVYGGGYAWTNYTTCVPSYWEAVGATNTRHALHYSVLGPDSANLTKVWSCYAYGNKVYFGGSDNNDDTPCYWDGKTAANIHPLPLTMAYNYGFVKYIRVSDTRIDCIGIGGVRLAHSIEQGGSILTQDVTRDQPDATNAVCMYNGMVYSAGALWTSNNKWAPCYWVGATIHNLPIENGGTSGVVMSICVRNGVVYCGGYYNNGTNDIPCYWVVDGDNVERYDLAGENGMVKTIFVD